MEADSSEVKDTKGRRNPEQNAALMRANIVQEIIDSERTYLRQLDILKQFWMDSLMSCDLMPGKTWSLLFGKINELVSVNKYLLQQIQGKPQCMGHTFFQLAPFLKIYSGYARDFRPAIEALQKLTECDKTFSKFRHNQESRPEVSQSLEALLITPIQRITRYPLLISELLSHTPPVHSDYGNLEKALNELMGVATKLNDTVIEQESFFKMRCIQASLYKSHPTILKTGRKLNKEGVLLKFNPRKASERAFFLFNDILLYCKPIGFSRLRMGDERPSSIGSGRLVCSGLFPLKYVGVEKVLGNPNVGQGVVFKITYSTGRYIMVMSKSVGEGNLWIEAISDAVEKVKEGKATLRRNRTSVYKLKRKVYVRKDDKELERSKRLRTALSPSKYSLDRLSNIVKGWTPTKRHGRKRKQSEAENDEAPNHSSSVGEYVSAEDLNVIYPDSDSDGSDHEYVSPIKTQRQAAISIRKATPSTMKYQGTPSRMKPHYPEKATPSRMKHYDADQGASSMKKPHYHDEATPSRMKHYDQESLSRMKHYDQDQGAPSRMKHYNQDQGAPSKMEHHQFEEATPSRIKHYDPAQGTPSRMKLCDPCQARPSCDPNRENPSRIRYRQSDQADLSKMPDQAKKKKETSPPRMLVARRICTPTSLAIGTVNENENWLCD